MPFKDPEKQREYCRKYYQKNKEQILEQQKEYQQNNKEKVAGHKRKYDIKRAENDPFFRIIKNYRRRIWDVYKHNIRSNTTLELLGCSPEELAQHLEKQFQPGMTHDNYGEWHIDHIRPIASFDLSDPEQEQECWHYTNLQPLWAKDNLSKGDKLIS